VVIFFFEAKIINQLYIIGAKKFKRQTAGLFRKLGRFLNCDDEAVNEDRSKD
jgi:hypothetical protein